MQSFKLCKIIANMKTQWELHCKPTLCSNSNRPKSSWQPQQSRTFWRFWVSLQAIHWNRL